MDKFLGKKRRHHKNRIKNKRKSDLVFKSNPSNLNKHATTPTVCSCIMCGNPRNHLGNSKEALTIQEKRSNIDLNSQLEEIDIPMV